LTITHKPSDRVIAVARSTSENTWAIQHADVSGQDWRNFQTRMIDQSQELEID
jgi:hypothetical protein